MHIVDRGGFDSVHMREIDQRGEYFIIRLKKKHNYDIIYEQQTQGERYELEIASRPRIRLLSTGLIKLHANPGLGDLKYVKFQYNSSKTCKFETIELVSNLKIDSLDIIELNAGEQQRQNSIFCNMDSDWKNFL